jgi:Domain of unknown function DUF29
VNKPAKIVAEPPINGPDYETDGYGWAVAQAALLRARRFDAIDWDNVAEEIETMGRSERSAYRSQLTRVLLHMLKWDAQPDRRGKSWWMSIMNGRREALRVLADNPGLKSSQAQLYDQALEDARDQAHIETGIPASIIAAISISQADAFERAIERPEQD